MDARLAAVGALLASPARYEADQALAPLEQCLAAQVSEGWYNADANTALLRLYQAEPNLIKADVLVSLLVKALAQVPAVDFSLAMMLVPASAAKLPAVALLVELWDLLQQGRFGEFWLRTKSSKVSIPGFEAAIRRHVLGCMSLTYKEVPGAVLCKALGVDSLGDLSPPLVANEAGVVVLASPELVQLRPDAELHISQFTDLIMSITHSPSRQGMNQVSKTSAEAVERMNKTLKEVNS